jgi:hypothetical protein
MHRFASLLLVVGVVVSGCGGGSDAPSKAEFGSNADKICKKAERALRGIETPESPAEAAKVVDEVIDTTQSSLDDLKDLDRPDGDAGEAADKFIASQEGVIQKGVPALEKLRDALKAKDQQAMAKAQAELQAIDSGDTDKLAVAAGAKGCAN